MLLRELLKKIVPKGLINHRRKSLAIQRSKKVLEDWINKGKVIPAPHQCKQSVIQEFQQKYKIQNFVETGTYEGQMVEAMTLFFKNLISIELSKELYDIAVEKFYGVSKISLIHGDSGVKLAEVIPTLDGPALFWLDGHYSAGKTAKAEKETPIMEELKAVFSSPFDNIILIDDAHCFTGQNDYPTIEALKEFIQKNKPSMQVVIDNDIIQVFKK